MARDFPGDEDEGSSSREEANGVGTKSPRRGGLYVRPMIVGADRDPPTDEIPT